MKPGTRTFAVLAVAGLLSALPVALWAQAVTEDQVVAALKEQGFTVIEAGTTFLGRIRITAEGPEGVREVVLNPRNGKVLRDIILDEGPRAAVEAPPRAVLEPVAPSVPASPATPEIGPAEADVARSLTAPVVPEALPGAALERAPERGAEQAGEP